LRAFALNGMLLVLSLREVAMDRNRMRKCGRAGAGNRIHDVRARWTIGTSVDAGGCGLLNTAEERGSCRSPTLRFSAMIFAVVAIVHLVRIVQGWQVQLGDLGVAMSVWWAGLAVSAALAVWGAVLLRR
jgi:hypothetical protein